MFHVRDTLVAVRPARSVIGCEARSVALAVTLLRDTAKGPAAEDMTFVTRTSMERLASARPLRGVSDKTARSPASGAERVTVPLLTLFAVLVSLISVLATA